MSHNTPSTDSSDASPESGRGGTLIQCVCGRPFRRRFPEQTQCQPCRKEQLAADAIRDDSHEGKKALRRLEELLEDDTDWSLVDPDHPGQMIKARDLAKRYREQTTPRPVGNNLRRWL